MVARGDLEWGVGVAAGGDLLRTGLDGQNLFGGFLWYSLPQ